MASERQEWRAGKLAEYLELGLEDEAAVREARAAEERVEARCAWVKQRIADMRAAQKALDAAWMRILDEHPDVDWESPDAPDLPDPPEQAAFDAIYDEIIAVRDHDRWPRHLHFPEV
jgi:hypothetical protein